MLAMACNSVCKETTVSCYRKAGFITNAESEELAEDGDKKPVVILGLTFRKK